MSGWVLIWSMMTLGQPSVAMEHFNTETACQAAAVAIRQLAEGQVGFLGQKLATRCLEDSAPASPG